MNTKSAAPAQAQAQDVVSKHQSVRCTEADIERAVVEAFTAVFRSKETAARPEA